MYVSAKSYPELINAIQNGFTFDLTANITGLGKFTLIPTSRSVTYQAKGNWADTKYSGQKLTLCKNQHTTTIHRTMEKYCSRSSKHQQID